MVKQPTDLERERRALGILEEVVETEESARPGRIAELCAGDEELRARVDQLVARANQRELQRMPGLPGVSDVLSATDAERAAGTRIGTYELVRPIARGGMGWVYEAIQENPQRQVALKMLRFDLDSEAARRRFQYESEVLAHLRHPGIAQVFEAGVHAEETSLGRREVPFFAMEFVEGARTIAEFAEEKGLSRAAIVALLSDVCDAVHHGHQKGVVHRDLKPGNVLVDGAGRAKVIDFGVARATNKELETTLETQDGQIVGTLPYMSPEQLAADAEAVDVRSDVYSLGVLLYELLCGRLPIETKGLSIAAAAQKIQSERPPRPRSIVSAIEEDLEAILLKALSRERELRYASAAALSADLRRFLAREPIEARPPSGSYRFRLYARRNPVVVGAAGAILLTLGGAATVSTLFAVQAKQALGHATRMKSELLAFNEAVMSDLMGNLGRIGLTVEQRREIIRFTTEQLGALRTAAGDDAEVLSSLASSYLRLGDVLGNPTQLNLGERQGVARAYAEADSIGVHLSELDPGAPDGPRIRALVHVRTGHLAGGNETAIAEYELALAGLRRVQAEHPDDEETLAALAATLSAMGTSFGGTKEYARSLEVFLEACEIQDELCRRDPEDLERARNRNGLLGKVGTARTALGDLDAALVDRQTAYEFNEDLVARFPASTQYRGELAESLIGLAETLWRFPHYESADEHFGLALEVLNELVAEDPDNAQFASHRALATFLLARCHHRWADDEREAGRESDERYEIARYTYLEARERIDEIRASNQPLGILGKVQQDIGAALQQIDGR